jgi:hypothetical protein
MGHCAAITIRTEQIGSIPFVTFPSTHSFGRQKKCGTVISEQLSTYRSGPPPTTTQNQIELERLRRNNVRIDQLRF